MRSHIPFTAGRLLVVGALHMEPFIWTLLIYTLSFNPGLQHDKNKDAFHAKQIFGSAGWLQDSDGIRVPKMCDVNRIQKSGSYIIDALLKRIIQFKMKKMQKSW
jgi:hypothetical protein